MTRIDPNNYPLLRGESWWVVHPNNSKCEFKVPTGAITVCTNDFLGFEQSKVYNVLGDDPNNGWITVLCGVNIIEMPYYIFARKFDAEAFIRGTFSLDGPKTAFDYKSTLPRFEG